MGWQWQMGSRCAEDLGEVRLNIARPSLMAM
jgi:hypothetical protein